MICAWGEAVKSCIRYSAQKLDESMLMKRHFDSHLTPMGVLLDGHPRETNPKETASFVGFGACSFEVRGGVGDGLHTSHIKHNAREPGQQTSTRFNVATQCENSKETWRLSYNQDAHQNNKNT